MVKLTKTDEFSSVFSFRKRISNQFLAVYYQPNALLTPRLGLVIGKNVSKLAVHRNYMRRVLRELFRLSLNENAVLQSVDIVIRVQKFYSSADFTQIKQEFNQLMLKLQRVNNI